MSKPRVPYEPPATLMGFLGRFYPPIAALVALPLGTEIGGFAGHGDPILGRPLAPHLYSPFAGWSWIASFAHNDSSALHSAVSAVLWTVLVCFMLTVFQMFVDFSHGRSFGPLNVVLVTFTLWADFDTVLRGFPPSFTWWGSGGVIDRGASSRRKRTGDP